MGLLETLTAMRQICRRAVARIPINAKCRCNICGQRVQRFLPYRGGWADVPPLIRQLGVVGSDVENYECPACGCHDRERHLLMYLKASGLLPMMTGAKILHLAPEQHLQRFVRGALPAEYIQGDLYPDRPDIERIDLQEVPYQANYFDFVLANHVLEHVQDHLQSLREIFRVLRPDGHAILQTPYSSILTHLFEDIGIQSNEARLQAYGQEDHRRMYGIDIVKIFESVGFISLTSNHLQLLPDIDPIRFGVNPKEPLLLFKKPKVTVEQQHIIAAPEKEGNEQGELKIGS